jgi:biopolymer transport protein TolQ
MDITTSGDAMSPLHLFLNADIVVKTVMFGLLGASIWTWAIIFTHSFRLRRINRQTERYERDFWAADDIDAFHDKRGAERLPIAAVLAAGIDESSRS